MAEPEEGVIDVRRFVNIGTEIPPDPLLVTEFEGFDEVTRAEIDALLDRIQALENQAQSLLNQAGIINQQSMDILDSLVDSTNVDGIRGLRSGPGGIEPNDRRDDICYKVVGFFEGTVLGSRDFVWKPDLPKTAHNGVTIFSPESIDAWDGQAVNLPNLYAQAGTGNGVWYAIDQSYWIEGAGASPTHQYNQLPINHLSTLGPAKPLYTLNPDLYAVYPFSGVIDLNQREHHFRRITLKPINDINLPENTILIRTGTTQLSITDTRSNEITIDGNTQNAGNKARGYIAYNIYGDRSPKSQYYINLKYCTYGILTDGDNECTRYDVFASYVDYLIDERDNDQSHWHVQAKYCSQWFKTDGQSSGRVEFFVEQSVAVPGYVPVGGPAGVPCIDIRGGKAYTLAGEVRAINGQPIVINDSPTGGNATGQVEFDNLAVIQVRGTVGMQIKNIDVVTGSFYMENFTMGGVELDDVRCAAGLTINIADHRGGVPVKFKDLGTTLGFNSQINVNVSRSAGSVAGFTASPTAIEFEDTYNCTVKVGQCMGNIVVGSGVTGVHVDLDADFVRNKKQITINSPTKNFSATIGGIINITQLENDVKPWAFNGLTVSSVYRGKDFISPMVWSNTGFVPQQTLVSNVAQLSVQGDLYKINNMCKVIGSPVFLADQGFPVYPAGTSPTSNWVKADGTVVVSGISTTQLKYTAVMSGDVSYDLLTDRFTAVRPNSTTSGQLIYFVPFGTYRVDLQVFSGGVMVIRDDVEQLEGVSPGQREVYDAVIDTDTGGGAGELRINNQGHPFTTVFQVHSITRIA